MSYVLARRLPAPGPSLALLSAAAGTKFLFVVALCSFRRRRACFPLRASATHSSSASSPTLRALQDGALELGIADPAEPEWHDETAQRQLLKKGDSFYVPPGNIYRLENHSADTESTIFWTIIKPIEGSE